MGLAQWMEGKPLAFTLAPSTTTAALSAVSSQQELALCRFWIVPFAIVAGLGIC